jgi:ribosome recycling factor
MQDILDNADAMMQKATEFLKKDLSAINTGRATPSLLEKVKVECYGDYMPVDRVASVSVVDSMTISAQVWDKSLVHDVEKAILAANLGFNPIVDGAIIRINIPKLSEERRKELCKIVKKHGEDRKVTIRGIRKDSLEKIKKVKSNFGEDLVKDFEKKIQNLTDRYVKEIDDIVAAKEKSLLTT